MVIARDSLWRRWGRTGVSGGPNLVRSIDLSLFLDQHFCKLLPARIRRHHEDRFPVLSGREQRPEKVKVLKTGGEQQCMRIDIGLRGMVQAQPHRTLKRVRNDTSTMNAR